MKEHKDVKHNYDVYVAVKQAQRNIFSIFNDRNVRLEE